MATIIKRKKAYSLVYNYVNEKGETKQKWETWHTHKDALKRKAEVENEILQGTFIAPNKQTIENFLYDFVSMYGEKQWGVSTYDSNCALIANYINPIIGDVMVQDVTTKTADKYVQTLQKTRPVSKRNKQPKNDFVPPTTIEKIIKLLRTAFKQAVRWEMVSKNPFEHCIIPKTEYKKRDIWTPDMIRQALDGCYDSNRRMDEKSFRDVVDGINYMTKNNLDYDQILAFSIANGDDYFSGLCINLIELPTNCTLTSTLINRLYMQLDYRAFINELFSWADDEIIEKSNNDDERDSSISENYLDEKKVWNSIVSQLDNNYGTTIPLSMFLQELSMVSKETEPKPTDVQCLTIHASKGKEFDYVFLTSLVEDELPSFQSVKKGDYSLEMEEERRNCFVAITRTKQNLILSYAHKYNGWSKKPSRFLTEMELI